MTGSGARSLRGAGLAPVEQPVAVGVEPVELAQRAEELPSREVAVAVAVHPAEPPRGLDAAGPGVAHAGPDRVAEPEAGQEHRPAPAEAEAVVAGDVFGADLAVAVAVP